jgi:hypothetical protein
VHVLDVLVDDINIDAGNREVTVSGTHPALSPDRTAHQNDQTRRARLS